MRHMLEENVVDVTYIEDFLLTYRVFDNDPLKICTRLLEWFDTPLFRDKVKFLFWFRGNALFALAITMQGTLAVRSWVFPLKIIIKIKRLIVRFFLFQKYIAIDQMLI